MSVKYPVLAEKRLKEIADDLASNIVVRSENGDVRRFSTPEEKEKLQPIFYSALLTLNFRSHEADDKAIQFIKDMSEFMCDQILPYANGYTTVYNPLDCAVKDIIKNERENSLSKE